MTKPYIPLSPAAAPVLTDETTLEAAINCLSDHLSLEMEGNYTPKDLYEILLRAASRGDSIKHTVSSLEAAPSGNSIRYHSL